jgi:hypothetical protein
MSEIKLLQLPLDKIKADGATRTRAFTDEHTAEKYAKALKSGRVGKKKWENIDVFWDGATYWLGDGFTRLRAHYLAERATILCNISEGGQREALLFGLEANHEHGKQLSAADHRYAVTLLLTDSEWAGWSDRELARRAYGDDSGGACQTVAEIRGQLSALKAQIDQGVPAAAAESPKRTVQRGDSVYDMAAPKITQERRTAKQADSDREWVGSAVEALEEAREDLTRISPERAGMALGAVDLALFSVRELETALALPLAA